MWLGSDWGKWLRFRGKHVFWEVPNENNHRSLSFSSFNWAASSKKPYLPLVPCLGLGDYHHTNSFSLSATYAGKNRLRPNNAMCLHIEQQGQGVFSLSRELKEACFDCQGSWQSTYSKWVAFFSSINIYWGQSRFWKNHGGQYKMISLFVELWFKWGRRTPKNISR